MAGATSYTFTSATLSADVQAWLNNPGTNFGWVMRSESEDTPGTIRRISGRLDPVNPPQLLVEYSLPQPFGQPPFLTNVACSGNQIRFSFDAESNRTYTIEISDSLTMDSWQTLTNLPASPINTTWHIVNDVSSNEKYFRVSTP